MSRNLIKKFNNVIKKDEVLDPLFKDIKLESYNYNKASAKEEDYNIIVQNIQLFDTLGIPFRYVYLHCNAMYFFIILDHFYNGNTKKIEKLFIDLVNLPGYKNSMILANPQYGSYSYNSLTNPFLIKKLTVKNSNAGKVNDFIKINDVDIENPFRNINSGSHYSDDDYINLFHEKNSFNNERLSNVDYFNRYFLGRFEDEATAVERFKKFLLSEFFRNQKKNKLMALIVLMEYAQCKAIFKILKDKNIDLHKFIENLPAIKHVIGKEYRDELYNFILKISKYNNETFLKLLNYGNYRKIRVECITLDEMNTHLAVINLAKKGMNSTFEEKENRMVMVNPKYENNEFFNLTKNTNIINNIGSLTSCCFRKNGAAESLLPCALSSPIAGIIWGEFGRKTWFSFVWEIIEESTIEGLFEINLILDNIESSITLTEKETDMIYQELKKRNVYNKIKLGFLRNDIPSSFLETTIKYRTKRDLMNVSMLEEEENGLVGVQEKSLVGVTVKDMIKHTLEDRPSYLINYEVNFERYGAYDDSRKTYTILDNSFDKENIFKIKVMDEGDFDRVSYIEKLVWKNNHDTDFKNINISESPSYVIASDKFIMGYLVTRMKWYNKETKEIIHNIKEYKNLKYKLRNDIIANSEDENYDEISKKEFEENLSKYEPMIYFEDIFFPKNKNILLRLKDIIEHVEKFIDEKDIKFVSASFNNNSKNFLKRIINKEGIEFIKDNRITNPYTPSLNPKTIDETKFKYTIVSEL